MHRKVIHWGSQALAPTTTVDSKYNELQWTKYYSFIWRVTPPTRLSVNPQPLSIKYFSTERRWLQRCEHSKQLSSVKNLTPVVLYDLLNSHQTYIIRLSYTTVIEKCGRPRNHGIVDCQTWLFRKLFHEVFNSIRLIQYWRAYLLGIARPGICE